MRVEWRIAQYMVLMSILLIFLSNPAIAADTKENDSWESFTGSNYINYLLVEDNYVWAATTGGVVRWNLKDSSYEKYIDVFPDKYITCIAADKMGNKWFGTYGKGIVKYDGINWVSYTEEDGLSSNYVTSIAVDLQGNKWIGTLFGGGVCKFDGAKFTAYTEYNSDLQSSDINCVVIDKSGNVWAGTGGGGASRFNGSSWVSYLPEDGLANNDVKSIAFDSKGNIWFGTIGSGISKFDGTNWTTFDYENSSVSNSIEFLAVDNEDRVWAGTMGGGVFMYDGTDWNSYKTEDGLLHNLVLHVLVSSNNDKWFGTQEGISRFDDTNWSSFQTSDVIPANTIKALQEDIAGNVWLGTTNGLVKYGQGQMKTFTTNDGLANNNILSIAIDSLDVKWIGTKNGVSKIDGTAWETYTTDNGLVNKYVHSIAIESNGVKWFGTEGGVSCYDGAAWKSYTKEDGLAESKVTSILIDFLGNKWFSTWGGGISKFDGSYWVTFDKSKGLPNEWISSSLMDSEGNLWFGTYGGGVIKYNGESWQVYDTSKGLIDNNVRALCLDAKGNLWVGTYGGVSRFDGTTWSSYTYKDGLADNDTYAIGADNFGSIYFGTESGFSVLTFSQESAISKGTPAYGDVLLIIPGKDEAYQQTPTYDYVNKRSAAIYGMFLKKGYNPEQLYYIGPSDNHDINKDGKIDVIPNYLEPSSGNLQQTINAVKTSGSQAPLLLVITGGYSNGSLALTNKDVVTAAQLDYMLDSFQTETQRDVLIMVEAGNSGDAYSNYTGDNRTIITSTTEEGAFISESMSFSSLLVNQCLDYNQDLKPAFDQATIFINQVSPDQKPTLNGEVTDLNPPSPDLTDRGDLILFVGGDDNAGCNSIWYYMKQLSQYVYNVFNQKRHFDHDEIFFISPDTTCDYNKDGFSDKKIIDSKSMEPPSIEDAFQWAKQSNNDGPLYIFLANHGLPKSFFMRYSDCKSSSNVTIDTSFLNSHLDDFQLETGRKVVLFMEACYSGSFVNDLSGDNRIIISSSNDSEVAILGQGGISFTYYLMNALAGGFSIENAFNLAKEKGGAPGSIIQYQHPQISNEIIDEIYVNGKFGAASGGIEFVETPPEIDFNASVDPVFELYATVNFPQLVENIWAVAIPPDYQLPGTLDEMLHPPVPTQSIGMAASSDGKYIAGMKDIKQVFIKEGTYKTTFYAKDINGNITTSSPVSVNITNGKTATPQTIEYKKGWNLLNICIAPEENDMNAIFGASLDNITSIWSWDQSAAKWRVNLPDQTPESILQYIESKGFFLMDTIQAGQGFWINADKDGGFDVAGLNPEDKSIMLIKGWNLIGLKDDQSVAVDSFFGSMQSPKANITENIVSAWKWNNVSSKWSVILPNTSGKTFLDYIQTKGFEKMEYIYPWEGFWVNGSEGLKMSDY